MDVLSDILDNLEMKGSLYFSTEFRAPWSVTVPAKPNVCRFHVVIQGNCHIEVPDTGDVLDLSRGDLVLVPHGYLHLLRCPAGLMPTPLSEVLENGTLSDDGCLRWGGEGAITRMVCGHFEFASEASHPILDSLPALIHVEATSGYEFAWIEHVMKFIGHEAGSGNPGSSAISRRLSEILFIQVIRHWAASAPQAVPVLPAIVDSRLGRALRAMHAEPARPWTVAALASEAALSRTAFALRFSEMVGSSPMEYLTLLRMQRARKLLRTEAGVAAVGEAVGYRSEAAFNRAFKKAFGEGPGAFRRMKAKERKTS